LEKSLGMNLREARLCLDCEELHRDEHCPMCASEAFMFVTQWIPANAGNRVVKPPLVPRPNDAVAEEHDRRVISS
jgi:hypothetical protein